MKHKVLMILMVVVVVVIVGLLFIQSCHQIPPQNGTVSQNWTVSMNWTVSNETEFLAQCQYYNLTFGKACFGKYLSYNYNRKIDNASVEFDHITYIFSNTTGEFIEKSVHWRNDLPDHLPQIISKKEAMRIGGGTRADLVYIDPESDVYPDVKPTPTNPCWAVSLYEYDPILNMPINTYVIVIDATTGEKLGRGVPVP